MGWEYLFLGAIFVAFIYFMMIRPQKKRTDEQKAMMANLGPGARVLLSSGIIGTIQAMGDAQVVVELAPGTDVTVLKQVIVKVMKPEDEEFEYAEAAQPGIADTPYGTAAVPGGVLPDDLGDGTDNPALWRGDAMSSDVPDDPTATIAPDEPTVAKN
ncbi:MAG: preprotein translocase subunit YajC [Actinomycetia bacterium]|nr:preprotein translocase subunit YajC [Actinomycetes bacterium]